MEMKVIERERIIKVVASNAIATGKGARTAAIASARKAALAGVAPMPTQKMEENGEMKKTKKAEQVTVGLWPLAAFMNQDEERPTAGRVCVGKFLVVRASRDLKRGDE